MKKWLIISLIINVILALALGMQHIIKHSINKKKHRDVQTSRYLFKHQFFQNMKTQKGSIIFFGDSQIEFCNWSELLDNQNIINRGISGDVTAGLLGRIEEVIRHQPSKIFIQIGTNDLGMGFPSAEIVDNLSQVIDLLQTQSPSTAIYVNSVFPVLDLAFGDSRNTEIRQLNRAYQALAKEKNFTFIDLYPSFADEQEHLKSSLTSDGLHLSYEGYKLWKMLLLPYLKS